MSLTVWIPESARETRVVFRCNVCGTKFPDTQRQQFERHVSACAKRNLDSIQETVDKRRDVFSDVAADKEMWKWVREKADTHGPDEANKRLRGRKGR